MTTTRDTWCSSCGVLREILAVIAGDAVCYECLRDAIDRYKETQCDKK